MLASIPTGATAFPVVAADLPGFYAVVANTLPTAPLERACPPEP